MSFAAHLVVKFTPNGGFRAGFSSELPGVIHRSFGKWYGSQMSYRPFAAAMQAAMDEAVRWNDALKFFKDFPFKDFLSEMGPERVQKEVDNAAIPEDWLKFPGDLQRLLKLHCMARVKGWF